jgi:hypothetical protein
MAALADARDAEMKFIPYQSIRDGKGNRVGCYGEVVLEKYIGSHKEEEDKYNFDCRWNGVKIEVKTIECNTPPLLHYDCSVSTYNDTQKCDWYAFMRVMRNNIGNYSYGYVMGFMESWRVKDVGRYTQANTIDEMNGHVVSHPCWKVTAGQCMSFEEFARQVLL